MRLLIDSSVCGGVDAELKAAGHDVVAVAGVWADDPGDETILAHAHAEGRCVITRDKDFGELAVLQHRPHAGILRLWYTPCRQQAAVAQAVLSQYGAELAAGAIVTASPYRIRLRMPMPPATP
jgi:predicted nuclease of predicted toxin-antitoxin system